MMLHAFALLDTKTGHFNVPFFFPHPGMAVRAVIDLAGDSNTTVGRHPADFTLCQVGAFDDQAGVFLPATPQQLGTVLALCGTPEPSPSLPLFPDEIRRPVDGRDS